VRHGAHPATRPCGEEEDVARELLATLDERQRAIAILSPHAPPDFVLANLPLVPDTARPGDAVPQFMRGVRDIREAWEAFPEDAAAALHFERAQPRGLAAKHMTPVQRRTLSTLVDVYVSRLPDDLASERGKIAIGDVHFAWAGTDKRCDGHYYRLHGDQFLIEYDNTQDNANHVHAVWRDLLGGDFGMDLLSDHLRDAH
jgi:hypothetical protein